MKVLFCLLFLATVGTPVLAQQPLRYTVWGDGLLKPQLAKSSLYFLGAGIRGEVSKPIRHTSNAWFAQVGYGHFFRKPTSAFTANIGLVNVGYRYQSRKLFTASVGIGAQYWNEQMRVRFPDYKLDETLNSLIPSTIVGIGVRVKPRYTLGLEYRGLFRPEAGRVALINNVALTIGYTF